MIKISICIIIEYSLINHTLLHFSIDLQYEKLKYIKHTISCYIEKNMKNKFEKLLNSRIRKEQTNRNGSKNTTKKRKGH